MKKLALIAGTLICFAGCAREETGDMTATETTTTTEREAVGTPAGSQVGSGAIANTNTLDQSRSSILQDTNSTETSSQPQNGSESTAPTPPAPPQPLQQGTQPNP